LGKSIILATLIFIFLLVVAIGCTPFARWSADNIYPALQKPYENEAPPTPTSFPASSEISAVIGGKGEGLSCSLPLPWLTEPLFFFDLNDDEAPLSLQFRQACAFHDYCYRHGAATYGYEQVDCDFMLQNSAYRLCRLIIKEDSFEAIDKCLSRARRVLLGVRVGGGTPFQAGGLSTYFEFDPMPAKADDYVVSRLVTLTKPLAFKDNNNKLKRSVISYHIKRGTIVPRLLWNCEEKDCMLNQASNQKYIEIFPNRAIVTPPRIVRTKQGDRVISVARDGFVDTRYYLTEYPRYAEGAFSNFRTLNEMHYDSSIQLFHMNSQEGVDDLFSFSHRGQNMLRKDVIEPIGKLENNKMVNTPNITDNYRLLQTEPILGKFLSTDSDQMLMISRGVNEKGEDYQKSILTYILNVFNGCVAKEDCSFRLELPEESEPSAAVTLADGRSGLLSIVTDNENLKLELRDLKHCKISPENCLANIAVDQLDLDASWIRMPVQVLPSLKENNKSSLLFFSRILCKKGDDRLICNDIKASEFPSDVELEFEYHRLNTAENKPQLERLGKGACTVHLNEQYTDNGSQLLVDNIKRAMPRADLKDSEKKWAFKDFADRWSNSQVIPGRIFERNVNEAQSEPDMLDVAVMFKGYPGLSLLLKGQKNENAEFHYSLAEFSPSYVTCERT